MGRDYKLFLKLFKHVSRIVGLKYIHLNAYTFIYRTSKLKKVQSRIETHFLFLKDAEGQTRKEKSRVRQGRARDKIRELKSLRQTEGRTARGRGRGRRVRGREGKGEEGKGGRN